MQSSTKLGTLFDHVATMMHRQADQMLQERLGIGMSQYMVLSALEKQPQLKQRALANMLGQTEASVSRQISLLKQKGLLASQVDPNERRQHLASLTGKGVKITVAAGEVLDQFYEQFFGILDDKKVSQQGVILGQLHNLSCAPGKRASCNHPEHASTPE